MAESFHLNDASGPEALAEVFSRTSKIMLGLESEIHELLLSGKIDSGRAADLLARMGESAWRAAGQAAEISNILGEKRG